MRMEKLLVNQLAQQVKLQSQLRHMIKTIIRQQLRLRLPYKAKRMRIIQEEKD